MFNHKLTAKALSFIKNESLSLFIQRCCEATERKRMSVEEFDSFVLTSEGVSDKLVLFLDENPSGSEEERVKTDRTVDGGQKSNSTT